MAGARIVDVPELFEQILILAADLPAARTANRPDRNQWRAELVPIRWLLRARRTSKQVQSVIEASPKLQEILFLRPDTPTGAPRANPLFNTDRLNETLRNAFGSVAGDLQVLHLGPGSTVRRLRLSYIYWSRTGREKSPIFVWHYTKEKAGGEAMQVAARDAHATPMGIMKRMYLDQPPKPARMTVKHALHTSTRVEIEMSEGGTFGDMVERMWKGARGGPAPW